jgi:hypothetical protein
MLKAKAGLNSMTSQIGTTHWYFIVSDMVDNKRHTKFIHSNFYTTLIKPSNLSNKLYKHKIDRKNYILKKDLFLTKTINFKHSFLGK